MIIFELILTTYTFLEAAGAGVKIGLNLKLNHHKQI
jgi:hypothetical protein